MPDITMCSGQNCEKKETCYRYMAIPSSWQSMFAEEMPEDCKYYWKISEKEAHDLRKRKQELLKAE